MGSRIEGTEEVKRRKHRTEKNRAETGLKSSFSWLSCGIVSDYDELLSSDDSNDPCPCVLILT